MRKVLNNFTLILLTALIITGLTVNPVQAVWHTFLDEHFNKDQQNQNLRWPWFTDLRNGIRWHWNPWTAYFRAENPPPPPTDYCWGIQDYIYCTRVLPNDDIQQSLWCAYTNRGDVNNPRWPEDEDYMNLQNAWVWWGPVDLSNAVSAAVSFWMYLDLDHYARDSMSCVAVNDYGLLRLEGEDFFNNVPVGKSYATSVGRDWSWRAFYLDSLIVAGEDTVSMLGEEEVYIAFVWHSDRYEVAGKGAFVDDVVFSWDDGLFDLVPIESVFGYPINEDSTDWNDTWPDEDDEVRFRMTYKAIGVGETPEFNISLYLDDFNETRPDSCLMYSESFVVQGSDTTKHVIIADTVWAVTTGEHLLRWEIDTPVDEGGSVEEGNEDNNVSDIEFDVIFNPAPVFNVLTPADSLIVLTGQQDAVIEWTLQDTLEDEEFRVFIYWTDDTTGLAGNPEIIWDNYGFIGRNFDAVRGEGSLVWAAGGDYGYAATLDSGQVFQIVGIATDNFPDNYTISVSPGWFGYFPIPDGLAESELDMPQKFGLMQAYPNPFNSSINIQYSLLTQENISLRLYDMRGRILQTLYEGSNSSGNHSLLWQPQGISAGVYILKLYNGNNTDLMKVIYMP